MNLNTDFLRTFTAVADTKSFTNAARLVHRSQAAVSMQIKRLEHEIGKQLFERSGKSVNLTPDGILLLRYARRIVKEHDEASDALSGSRRREIIRLGFSEHYTHGILPNLMRRFSSSYPDALIELLCQNCDVIRQSIQNGTLDIGLCPQTQRGGQVIYYDPVVWASKPGFVIDKSKPLSLAMFSEGCIFRKWALEALDKADFSYSIYFVSQSISGIIDAIRSGLAIAPLVKSTVPPDLTIVDPKAGLPMLPVSNLALHISPSSHSPALSCFADYLIASFQEKV